MRTRIVELKVHRVRLTGLQARVKAAEEELRHAVTALAKAKQRYNN